MKRFLYFLIYSFILSNTINAQTGSISGLVEVDGNPIEFATIAVVNNPTFGTISDKNGTFTIKNIPYGEYKLEVSFIGFEKEKKSIIINDENEHIKTQFNLTSTVNILDAIVVTGTKTFKRQTNSPVIVNVVSSQTLENVQACNLSEGLRFQPGLRVENACQTCNYTQLRINGLGGGYSQILVNGRPIFSPLTGLYGLEQLPVNMIERIEVVKGGGSSLYGSSAIGGTVNVLTKLPEKNEYEINTFYQNINGKANDFMLNGNASVVSKKKNVGASFFFSQRNRSFYDHNDDNYSELPKLKNTSFGINSFFLPTENQKIELSISNINEYRFGGEMEDIPAFLAQQSEERNHSVWLGSLDYQIDFKNKKTSFISYFAGQNTDRNHYTGIFPDDSVEVQNHISNPPYGTSETTTLMGGVQLNHRVTNFLGGNNTFTLGAEYIMDDVFDEIPSYNYLIDQTTKNFGAFAQSDWEIFPSLTLLTGLRIDQHNLIDGVVFSPRGSLLYKLKQNTQFRLNYGYGFRAPQAFDTDLHIAFAGGGVSRIQLSPNLQEERSQSVSASVNYDKATEDFIAGFTIEGFYTRLDNAFFLNPIGEDAFGEVFIKENGQGATVAGGTLELRANYKKKVQLETGFTIQRSQFDEKVQYIDELEGIREFIRTPNEYGFAVLSIMPNEKINANINYVYTGNMKVPHFAGAPNQTIDEIYTSNAFHEVNVRAGYTLKMKKIKSEIEFYGGIKNLFNAYQNNFDIGKNRDSNFVFGPGLPRTFFIGLKLASF